jgi:hypothetical protein
MNIVIHHPKPTSFSTHFSTFLDPFKSFLLSPNSHSPTFPPPLEHDSSAVYQPHSTLHGYLQSQRIILRLPTFIPRLSRDFIRAALDGVACAFDGIAYAGGYTGESVAYAFA